MENETTTEEEQQQEIQQPKIAKTFSDIISNPELLKKVESLGFTSPTEVQAQSVPVALEGHDAIIQAQTGSGKTLAFLLPLCAMLMDKKLESNPNSTISLFIAPTRELAIQIEQVVKDLDIGIAPNVLIGGVDMDKQKKTLSKDRRVIVGTPGRILDFLKQRLIKLNECSYFVLDEADEMLSMGFIEDVRAILSRLPNKRQGLFVSATMSGRVGNACSQLLGQA